MNEDNPQDIAFSTESDKVVQEMEGVNEGTQGKANVPNDASKLGYTWSGGDVAPTELKQPKTATTTQVTGDEEIEKPTEEAVIIQDYTESIIEDEIEKRYEYMGALTDKYRDDKIYMQALIKTEQDIESMGGMSPSKQIYRFSQELEQYGDKITDIDVKEIADKYGLAYVDGEVEVLPNNLKTYQERLEKNMRFALNEKAKNEKDPFMVDVLKTISGSTDRTIGMIPTGAIAMVEQGINAISEGFGGKRIIGDGWKEVAMARMEDIEAVIEDGSRYDATIEEHLANGEYGKAVGNTALQVSQQLPMLLTLGLSGAANVSSKAMLGAMTLPQESVRQMSTDKPVHIQMASSLLNSTAEVIFEDLTTVSIMKKNAKLMKQFGAEQSKDILQNTMRPYIERQMIKGLRISGDMAKEVAGEVSTKWSQDLVEYYVNGNKDIDFSEGLTDLVIVSAATGGGMTGGTQLISDLDNQQLKRTLRTLPEELSLDDRIKSFDLIVEKEALKQKMKQTDDAFEDSYKARISEINEELISINKEYLPKTKENEIQEEQTEVQTERQAVESDESPVTIDQIIEIKDEPIDETDIEFSDEFKNNYQDLKAFIRDSKTPQEGVKTEKERVDLLKSEANKFITENSEELKKLKGVKIPPVVRRINNATTDVQLNNALNYVNTLLTDNKARLREVEKNEVNAKTKKEVSAIKGKKGEIKKEYNVQDADTRAEVQGRYDLLNDIANLPDEVWDDMSLEASKALNEEVKANKAVIREAALVEKGQRKQEAIDTENKMLEVVLPKKTKDSTVEYVEKGSTASDKSVNKGNTFEHNLYSAAEKLQAKGQDKSKVGEGYIPTEIIQPIDESLEKHKAETARSTNELNDKVKELYSPTLGITETVYAKLSNDKTTIPITEEKDGEQFTSNPEFSRGELIQYYMWMKDETLHETLFAPKKKAANEMMETGNGFTQETVDAINNYLTESDKALADFLLEKYKENKDRYADDMLRNFGVSMGIENYSPISRKYMEESNTMDMNYFNKQSNQATIKNNSMIGRKVNKGSLQPTNAIENFLKYKDNMEWTFQLHEPLQKYKNAFGSKKVQRAIEREHGTEFVKLFKEYEQLLARDYSMLKGGDVTLDKIINATSRGALSINPNIPLKQLFSTTLAMTYTDPISFGKHMVDIAVDYTKEKMGKSTLLSDIWSSDYIQTRGSVGLDISPRNMTGERKTSRYDMLNAFTTVLGKGLSKGTAAIEHIDKVASTMGGYSVFKTKYNQYKKYMDDATAKEKAFREMGAFIRNTQQSNSILNNSMTRMKSGSIGRSTAMFTSGMMQLWRLEMSSWRQIANGKNIGDNMKRIALLHGLLPALYQLSADGLLGQLIGGEELEPDKENMLTSLLFGNMSGIMYLNMPINVMRQYMMVGGRYAGGSATPPPVSNMIKAIRDINELVGYVSHPELYNEQEEQRLKDNVKKSVPQAFGIPVSQMEKWFEYFKELPYMDGVSDLIPLDFFDGSVGRKREDAREALKSRLEPALYLDNKYGRGYAFDEEGKLTPQGKSGVQQYIIEKNIKSGKYAGYKDVVDQLMDLGAPGTINKMAVARLLKNQMDRSGFQFMMKQLYKKTNYTVKGKDYKIGGIINKSMVELVYGYEPEWLKEMDNIKD